MILKFDKKTVLVGFLAAGSVLVPFLAAAQGSGITGQVNPPVVNFTFNDVVKVLNTIVSWIFTVFLILAVIFIILAAFYYLTSGGDPEKVKTATKNLVFAAVAIAVALLSVAVRFVVQDLLGVRIS